MNMKSRYALEREILKYLQKHRIMPTEIFATKRFIDALKKEIEKTSIYFALAKNEKFYEVNDAKLIYQGVKIIELKDFIILK